MSLPSPQSWLVFAAALLPALILSILWHELGHVVAGRCAGFEVFAWGIGIRRPWIRLRLGGTILYVAWPLTLGLTIARPRRVALEHQPLAESFLIAGGPLASGLAFAAGLAAWRYWPGSDVVLAWLAISALHCIGSAIPLSESVGAARLRSDGRQLLDRIVHGRQPRADSLSAVLATSRALADLLAALRHEPGARHFRAAQSIFSALLGDTVAAEACLARVSTTASGLESRERLEVLARAAIAVANASDGAPESPSAILTAFPDDAGARFIHDEMEARWRLARGEDIQSQINHLHDQGSAASRRDWLAYADVLRFEAESADDPEAECRDLLRRHGQFVSQSTRARLLPITTERLVQRGEMDRARVMFEEARTAIAAEAALIEPAATRACYVAKAAAPLQRAVTAANADWPLFIVDLSSAKGRQARRLVSAWFGATNEDDQTAPRGDGFARLTFRLGLSALVASTLCGIAFPLRPFAEFELGPFLWLSGVFIAWLVVLVTTCASLLRSERRYGSVALGALLATIAVAHVMRFLPPPGHSERAAWHGDPEE